MKLVFLDFETFFSEDFTLRKLSMEAYVRDPAFSVHGLAMSAGAGEAPVSWLTHEQISRLPKNIFDNCVVVAHNAAFDGLILEHVYGFSPGSYIDTLGMARQVLSPGQPKSLEALAALYRLSPKTVPYNEFRGFRWQDMSPDLQATLADGARHDVALLRQVFLRLFRAFPARELPILDMTVKMFTRPRLLGDRAALHQVWADEAIRKRDMLRELDISAEDLQSTRKFSVLLALNGVTVEGKEGKHGPIPALAKTDAFMQGLLDHPNEKVATLAAARLGIKSTLNQARAERLYHMAERGGMTVALNYCGAETTTRWSGGDKVNFQNLPRGGGLRKALHAPPDSRVVVVDASQIECRLLNGFAGQQDVLAMFRDGTDIYCENATQFYRRRISKADKAERGLGKTIELGCGYQMGAERFRETCRQGPMGSPPLDLSLEEAARAVQVYRDGHPFVVDLWRQAARMIARLAGGADTEWGCLGIEPRRGGAPARIVGPNGGWIQYNNLRFDSETRTWVYEGRRGTKKLYGGKVVENVIQFLARVFLSDCMIALKDETGEIPVLCTHDELVYVVADYKAQEFFAKAVNRLSTPPTWMPYVPLAAEGGVSQAYEK